MQSGDFRATPAAFFSWEERVSRRNPATVCCTWATRPEGQAGSPLTLSCYETADRQEPRSLEDVQRTHLATSNDCPWSPHTAGS